MYFFSIIALFYSFGQATMGKRERRERWSTINNNYQQLSRAREQAEGVELPHPLACRYVRQGTLPGKAKTGNVVTLAIADDDDMTVVKEFVYVNSRICPTLPIRRWGEKYRRLD